MLWFLHQTEREREVGVEVEEIRSHAGDLDRTLCIKRLENIRCILIHPRVIIRVQHDTRCIPVRKVYCLCSSDVFI